MKERGEKLDDLRTQIESEVRYANITIIEGHDASQYGIGIVSTRIAEMVLRDEHAVIPIGSYQREFGVTLSLPSVIGSEGVVRVMQPVLSAAEESTLEKSAENLRWELQRAKLARIGGCSSRPLTQTARSIELPTLTPTTASSGALPESPPPAE